MQTGMGERIYVMSSIIIEGPGIFVTMWPKYIQHQL